MATTFKTLLNDDKTTTRTLLHEAIPITGSILSGTYAEPGAVGSSIKEYSHGMFHSVHDYPYLSSSANHIFDMTCGLHSTSTLATSSNSDYTKKKNIYNQMAQVLMGHDTTGSIRKFDEDGNIADGGTKYDDVLFVNFARLLAKDEIKKGSFELELGVSGSYSNPFGKLLTVGYQAGIAVLTKGVFVGFSSSADGLNSSGKISSGSAESTMDMDGSGTTADTLLQTGTINAVNNGVRHRIKKVSFNNTTELNSTIYFCRVNSNEFNYSSNPTYLSSSQIRVKRSSTDAPVSYFTTVGLYSADNELLAVGKLSEPLKKDPTTDMTVRVRLDY